MFLRSGWVITGLRKSCVLSCFFSHEGKTVSPVTENSRLVVSGPPAGLVGLVLSPPRGGHSRAAESPPAPPLRTEERRFACCTGGGSGRRSGRSEFSAPFRVAACGSPSWQRCPGDETVHGCEQQTSYFLEPNVSGKRENGRGSPVGLPMNVLHLESILIQRTIIPVWFFVALLF